MSKEATYYEREEYSNKLNFFRLMDLLVTNKSTSKLECIILFSISFIQLISGFFNNNIGLFTSSSEAPDNYLASLQDIIRIKDILNNNFGTFRTIMYLLFVVLILFTVLFIYV